MFVLRKGILSFANLFVSILQRGANSKDLLLTNLNVIVFIQ